MEYPNSKPGDYVVGSYHENGNQIKPGKVQGDQDQITDLQEMFASHGERMGGRLLTKATTKVTKSKKKPKKVVVEEDEEPEFKSLWEHVQAKKEGDSRSHSENEHPRTKKFIYLFNKLGKIKLNVEEVLECEQAYCLVFRDEDDMIFTPNAGETLSMINLQGDEVTVYYANSLFTWTDGKKQLLILFKKDDDE